jgi:hypothetical protein
MPKYIAIPSDSDLTGDELVLAKARHLHKRIGLLLEALDLPGQRKSAINRLRTIVDPELRAQYERDQTAQREWLDGLRDRTAIRAAFESDLLVVRALRKYLRKHFKVEEVTASGFMAKVQEYLAENPEAVRVGNAFLSKGWTFTAVQDLLAVEPREWLLDAMSTDLVISDSTLESLLTGRLHSRRRYKSLRRLRAPDSP